MQAPHQKQLVRAAQTGMILGSLNYVLVGMIQAASVSREFSLLPLDKKEGSFFITCSVCRMVRVLVFGSLDGHSKPRDRGARFGMRSGSMT